MYTIFLDTSFRAQHQLSFTDGTQEPLHEHNWGVSVAVSSPKLDTDDLVIDFEELKTLLEGILLDFRGQRLETVGYFEQRNASAENVAHIIFEKIAPMLPDTVKLEYVEVTEAPGCRARFSAD
ncbi:MAG: 6-pyruvoyl trahydropterin synthase family protein [Planctomycetota bacterium]|jgi:6-pyruvoyl-tetrahydropterin synthase